MTTETHQNPQPTVALITGANKGIGLETARQLGKLGWIVWLGARDADLGNEATKTLAAQGVDARFVQLDVTDDSSVKAAQAVIIEAGTGLDVLINNAGVGGTWAGPADTTAADLESVYAVNVQGPVRVTHTFLGLLRESAHPRIVNVSSGMGSFGVTNDPARFESTMQGIAYQSSKTALNMVTSQYAKALAPIKVNAVDPGYTATDITGNTGQPVEQGAAASVRAATIGPDGPTGAFWDREGPVAW